MKYKRSILHLIFCVCVFLNIGRSREFQKGDNFKKINM